MKLILTIIAGVLSAVGYVVMWSIPITRWLLEKAWQRIWWRPEAEVHGDAAWATPKDLKEAGNLSGDGFYVGVLDGKRVFTHRESSLLFFTRPGSGKSQTIGGSLRQETDSNLLIVDPAGELHKYHAEFLRERGYVVHQLDLTKPGEGYDPLSFFKASTPAGFTRDMRTFCALAVQDGDVREEHFINMVRNLLAGVLTAQYRYGSEASLAAATKVLSVGGPSKRRSYFEKMKAYDDDLINIAVNAFEEAGDREKGSFATTMSIKLAPWIDPYTTQLCLNGEWTWEDLYLGGQKHAVFIKGGVDDGVTTSDYVRLVVGLAVASVLREYRRTETPLRRRLHVYADEGKLLGNCQPIVTVITQMRKMGVNAFLCFQSVKQVRSLYGRDTELVSSCDTMITGGMSDIEIYEDFSRLIGDKTITTYSYTKGRGGESEGVQKAPRKLAKPDELRRTPPGEIVALLGALSVRMEMNFISRKNRDGSNKDVIYK